LDSYWDDGEKCYNISKDATSPITGRTFSPETLKKLCEIRSNQSEETKQKISKTISGKPKTPEHIQNVIVGRRGTIQKNNKSGCPGVYWKREPHSKWCAEISATGKKIFLGLFDNIDDAIKARKDAELKYF
jgi:hypothetical protein